MSNVSMTTTTRDDDRLVWLRNVLTAIMEVAPVSYQQKKKASRFLNRMPDWMLVNWAEALSIDYIGGSSQYPALAEQAKSDTGRQLAQEYLDTHDAVPAGFCLDRLVRSVLKLAQEGRLPVDSNMVERQVCALACSECTEDGIAFAQKAREILSEPAHPNHILVDYQIALENGDREKLEALDGVLTGGRYGEWVNARLDEAKRYMGLDYPIFEIRFGERSPQWDALWGNIIKGGSDD
jgi:hypothetical protein